MSTNLKGDNTLRIGTRDEIGPWVLKNGETGIGSHHERWQSEFEVVYDKYAELNLVPEEIAGVLEGVPIEGPEGIITLRSDYCCYWYDLLHPDSECAPECECKGCGFC